MAKPVFHLTIDGADAGPVVRLSGKERLSAPYSFTVETGAPEGGPPGAAALDGVGAEAELSWDLAGGSARTIKGIVDAVDAWHGGARVTIVPAALAYSDAMDHRVFVDKDTIAIARAVLGEHDVDLEVRVGRSLPRRAQCIQQWESDLDFLTRLLSEEGIAWFFASGGEAMVLAGEPRSFDDDGLSLPAREEAGMEALEAVYSARLAGKIAPDAVNLGEYDFARPAVDPAAQASAGKRGLRLHQFPRGWPAADAGADLAKIRLEEARREARVLEGATTNGALRPGLIVALEGAADDRLNDRWLVIEVEHTGRDYTSSARPYEARFRAVPAAAGYRPARAAPPRMGGVQTAVIAGPAGAEIHPDEHARVRVRHRWDGRAPGDDRSSAWARTAQPATSGGVMLPRVGWEALTAFGGASGDDPWVLGRLDNGAARPAEPQPGKKVWSAWGTPTTPGGGSVNRIAMDDTAGNEGMHFVASSKVEENTANDKVTAIKADDTWSVAAARTLSVGKVFEQAVDGAQTVSIGASRKVDIAANNSVTSASETVIIGGLRRINTGGDLASRCSTFLRVVAGMHMELPIEHQTRLVLGGSLVATGGAWATVAGPSASIGVGGASALAVAGPKSVAAPDIVIESRAALSETYAARTVSAGAGIGYDHSGSLSYVAGSATWSAPSITFKAPLIKIQTPGVTLTISGGIVVSGAVSASVASAVRGNVKLT